MPIEGRRDGQAPADVPAEGERDRHMNRATAAAGTALLLLTALAVPAAAAGPARPDISLDRVCVESAGLTVDISWVNQPTAWVDSSYRIDLTWDGPGNETYVTSVSGSTASPHGTLTSSVPPLAGVGWDHWGKVSARAVVGFEGRTRATRQPDGGWPSC